MAQVVPRFMVDFKLRIGKTRHTKKSIGFGPDWWQLSALAANPSFLHNWLIIFTSDYISHINNNRDNVNLSFFLFPS